MTPVMLCPVAQSNRGDLPVALCDVVKAVLAAFTAARPLSFPTFLPLLQPDLIVTNASLRSVLWAS